MGARFVGRRFPPAHAVNGLLGCQVVDNQSVGSPSVAAGNQEAQVMGTVDALQRFGRRFVHGAENRGSVDRTIVLLEFADGTADPV